MSWSSKRQASTTFSSTKAKYMSLILATKKVVWLRKLLGNLGYQQLVVTPLYCNNQSAITLSQNPKYHSRTKHVEMQHHYIQENSGKRRSKRDLLCYKKYGS